MELNLENAWIFLSIELESKGFGHDEVDTFFNGYGQYMTEGMYHLGKYIHQHPDASKEDVIKMYQKIKNYFWEMDYKNTEKAIKEIAEERGYNAQSVKAAMVLFSFYDNNGKSVLELFEKIENERELTFEIIKRIEEHQEHAKKLDNFNREQDRVCEIFANKSYSADLLKDVKLAMEFTFSTHVPVEYDVIVRAVEQAESEADLRKRISPIIAVVFTELHIYEEE